MIDYLRTPDACFADLPGYDFAPRYIDTLKGYDGLRVHYLDEGDQGADRTFLCLHGQPAWCYLYRKMIPIFANAGGRVIAPDWLGFGRSDKPVADEFYTFNRHRDMMIAFIEALDLKNITLVCQDWGGLLGLTLPMDLPDRFSRILVMNTAIATGRSLGEGFAAWRKYANSRPDLDIAALMKRSTPSMTEAEAAAYSAPYRDKRFKAGVRRFPQLVMTDEDMEGADISRGAEAWLSSEWNGASFMAIGLADPVFGRDHMHALRAKIRNCPQPLEIAEAGHFVQEHGDIVAKAALAKWGGK